MQEKASLAKDRGNILFIIVLARLSSILLLSFTFG